MKQKFFKKFFLTTILIVLLSITFITVILSFFVSTYLTNEKLKILEDNCTAIFELCNEVDSNKLKDVMRSEVFFAVSRATEADVFICDTKGNVAICSCEDWKIDGLCTHNSKRVSSNILQRLKTQDYKENGNLEGLYDKTLFTYAKLLKNSDGLAVGAVFSTLSPTNIQLFYRKILQMFFFSALVPIAIMFCAEYIISYRFTRPLNLMAEASRSMAKGDFSKRIPVSGNDEISELAVAFNQMTSSLVQIEGTRRSFIANISHELKTPMTTIGGFIDGIIDGTIPKERHNYYLGVVSNEIKRLSRLVQSMLSLAKLESGELKVNKSNFDLTDLLFNILISQEQRINENNLEISGLEEMGQVFLNADYDLIYQVAYNLIDNAIKFTNKGGKITFKVNRLENKITFKIRNTGEGIDEKDLPFIFDRFYKTDRSRSRVKDSTGLGLYIANTIVSIHGGEMAVQSVKNSFTEFSFTLPNNQ